MTKNITNSSQLKIIEINLKNIDEDAVKTIYDMVSERKTSYVLDLTRVETCVTNFFEMFKRKKGKKLMLVNVDSKILATLYMTGYDKFVRVFEDSFSLINDKNELINRRFMLL